MKQSKSYVAWILHTFPTLQTFTKRTYNRFKVDRADKQKTYAGENRPHRQVS